MAPRAVCDVKGWNTGHCTGPSVFAERKTLEVKHVTEQRQGGVTSTALAWPTETPHLNSAKHPRAGPRRGAGVGCDMPPVPSATTVPGCPSLPHHAQPGTAPGAARWRPGPGRGAGVRSRGRGRPVACAAARRAAEELGHRRAVHPRCFSTASLCLTFKADVLYVLGAEGAAGVGQWPRSPPAPVSEFPISVWCTVSRVLPNSRERTLWKLIQCIANFEISVLGLQKAAGGPGTHSAFTFHSSVSRTGTAHGAQPAPQHPFRWTHSAVTRETVNLPQVSTDITSAASDPYKIFCFNLGKSFVITEI